MVKRNSSKTKMIDCEWAWQHLCEKDGVPCPGLDECRHAEPEEVLLVPLKAGLKFMSKQRKFRPL